MDTIAKNSQCYHPLPSEVERCEYETLVKIARGFCDAAGALMPLWPKLDLSQAELVVPERAVVPPPAPARPGHLVEWHGSSLQCNVCLRVFRSVKHIGGGCTGCPNPKLQNEQMASLGHDSVALDCDNGTVLIACRRCGAMSSGGYVRALGAPCLPTAKGRDRTWQPLLRGRHPKKAGVRVEQGPLAAADIF